MKFDFSSGDRGSKVEEAGQFLKDSINQSLETFYETYSTYLGEDTNKLFKNIDPQNPSASLTNYTELVHDVISRALENGEEGLAGIQGVSDRLPTY